MLTFSGCSYRHRILPHWCWLLDNSTMAFARGKKELNGNTWILQLWVLCPDRKGVRVNMAEGKAVPSRNTSERTIFRIYCLPHYNHVTRWKPTNVNKSIYLAFYESQIGQRSLKTFPQCNHENIIFNELYKLVTKCRKDGSFSSSTFPPWKAYF